MADWSYKLNSDYVKSLPRDVQRTMRNERTIINALIKAAKARGYFVRALNTADEVSPITKQTNLIEPVLYACDEAWLHILEPSPDKAGKYRKVCGFYFIYGNGNEGCDVVSDGSWKETPERNTRDIYEAIEAAGDAAARKCEARI